MSKDIFRADMSASSPADGLTRTYEKNKWQLIDFETVEGVAGTMVSAFPDHNCPELTLRLDAHGPHRIYLGVNYTKTRYDQFPSYGQLEVRLSDEEAFRRIGAEPLENNPKKLGIKNEMYKSIQEAYWKTVDLGGQSLVFRQPIPPFGPPEQLSIANLSYVRLVPVNEGERALIQEAQPRQETKRLAAVYCTGHLTGHAAGTNTYHPTDESWFTHELTPYLESDFDIFIFEAHRGNFCCYPTRIGHLGTEKNKWERDWVDPLGTFTKLGHEHGLKVFSSMRLFGVQYPMNLAPIAWATYYHERAQYAKRDKNGVPLTGLSLAYPEVREYWLSLLREALAYDIDGIQMHLNRATPFVYYESPVIESFMEQYGEDPRQLDEEDPRWLAHRAGYVTRFLREIRELVDRKPGRELGVTIYGSAHKYDPQPQGYHPLRYLCDVETWISERIINYLMPSPDVNLDQMLSWRRLAADKVHLWPDLMPRTQPPEAYAALAMKYYDAGADGFCVWDGERRTPRISEWAAVRRLGHRELLSSLEKQGPSYYRRVSLKTLGGFSAKESFHDG